MVITRITVQERNQNRYSVYIDKGSGEEFGFGVDKDVLVQFGLRKGLELNEELIKEIAHEDEVKKALNLCYSFLSYRMRSEFEVIAYLKKKAIPHPIIEQALERLKKQGYVNDRAFAESYIRDKKHLSDKGPLLLKKELLEKGVSETVIDDALACYPKDEQLEKAKRIVSKKAKTVNDSYQRFRQKLGQSLQQKGFTWDVIEEALHKLPEKNDEIEREILQKYAEKAHARYKKYEGFEYEQKMKQYLFRKGFPIEEIERVLEDLRDEKESSDGKAF